MAIPRVVVPDAGDDEAGLKFCLDYAKKIVDDPQYKIERVLLLVHTKQQLTNTSLPNYLGKATAKTLADNGTVGFGRVQIQAATLKTLSSVRNGTLIIAFWGDRKMMNQVDGLGNAAGVVTFPSLPYSLDAWIETWNPIVHGQQRAAPQKLITDPIVEVALQTLTRLVNHGNTGLHSHYKDMTDRFLRILRAKKHPLDPDKIRQWAIRNKWNPGLAGDLEKLARKVADLKTKPSINSIENGEDTYQRWQDSLQPAAPPKA